MTAGNEQWTDDEFVAAYAARLEVEPAEAPTLAGLRELHHAHVGRIPFENLSIHLDEPVSLEPGRLAQKVLGRSRGGFCYELNGMFARLLDILGFGVTLSAARVWDGDSFGPPLDHLVLLVEAGADGNWLADVGFGDHSLYPIAWEPDSDQVEPGGYLPTGGRRKRRFRSVSQRLRAISHRNSSPGP